MVEYAAWVAGTGSSAPLDWAARQEELIRRKVGFGVSVADLAEEAGVGCEHYRRRYRKARGRSLRDFIKRARMERACQLLRVTDQDIRRIARACDYRSPATFCHRFRAEMGATPTEWRQANRI